MKKIMMLTLTVVFITIYSTVVAQSPTIVTPTAPTSEKNLLDKQIKILKEKIATKVAEISKKSKQVIVGTVADIDEAGFTIDHDGKTTKVLIDSDVTKFNNLIGNKEITFKNLKQGNYVVVYGIALNSEFSAEGTYLQPQYEILFGTIKSVEKQGYYIEVVTADQETIIVDIEKSTEQKLINTKTLKIEASGFADYKESDHIQFVVVKQEKDSQRVSAVRTLIVPSSISQ